MKIYKITCGLLVAALWLTAQGQTADELAKGGAAAVKACALKLINVTERNEKDDTNERVALHGVCVHARYNSIAEAVEQGILEAFAETKKTEVKLYLLEQLYYTAGEKSVAALSPLLTDPQYCHEVYKVLVAIPDAAKVAGPAFLKALPDAKGMCRYEIMQALGELGIADAAAEAVKDAKSDDRRARLIAYEALARMDSPLAKAAFAAWLPDSAKLSRYERSVVDGALGEYLKNLLAWGKADDAIQLAETWTKARPGDIAIACAALEAYAGAPQGDALLVNGLVNDELRVRLSAKRLLLKNLSANRLALIAKTLDAKKADKAPLALELLANSGDKAQLPAVEVVIGWEDEAARTAAIKAVVALNGKDSLGRLPAWLADERAGVSAAAKAAVASVKAPLADGLAALALQSKDAVQQGVLEIIEKRNDTAALPKISALADIGDLEMKQTLCRIHGNIGDETSMPFILNQLQKAEDKKSILAAEKGLLTLCRRLGDAKLYLPALKNAFAASKAEAKPSLLKAVALAGSQEALDMEVAAWKNEGDAVKEAALRTLAEWPNVAALPTLRDIAATTEKPLLQVLAFRGCVRLIPMQNKKNAEKADDMAAMVGLAKRVDERKLAVGAIGNLTDAKSLTYLLDYLKDDELKGEAASAIVNLSEKLRGGECVAPLRQIMPLLNDKQKERAQACLALISENIGKIMRWQVSPAYRVDGKDYLQLQNIEFAPEKADEAANVKWKATDADKTGKVNLLKAVENANQVTAYARCIIRVAAATKAQIMLGSDDAAKVWLNGALIENVNVPRAYTANEDKMKVELKAGDNVLLVKIGQGGGQWELGAKVCAEDGGPLDGMVLTIME
ncbi:MAG: hypothetical protein K6G44_03620 [Lentisphaeria bacterium]|nr:hypothetical protein [Lentisphaeria bacterium]